MLLLCFSCETQKPQTSDVQDYTLHEEFYICYNPGSVNHGQVCTPECLQAGNAAYYCWLLKKQDCEKDQFLEWQQEHCHLFE